LQAVSHPESCCGEVFGEEEELDMYAHMAYSVPDG
jgi:hypothetical protein